MTEDMRELASDVGTEALQHAERQAAAGTTTVLARLNPRSTVAQGDHVELVVDTHRLHFFDPDDGTGIYA
jgi:multiple sugar transport system ATP-binding protein